MQRGDLRTAERELDGFSAWEGRRDIHGSMWAQALGGIAREAGRYQEAQRHFEQSSAIRVALGHGDIFGRGKIQQCEDAQRTARRRRGPRTPTPGENTNRTGGDLSE